MLQTSQEHCKYPHNKDEENIAQENNTTETTHLQYNEQNIEAIEVFCFEFVQKGWKQKLR